MSWGRDFVFNRRGSTSWKLQALENFVLVSRGLLRAFLAKVDWRNSDPYCMLLNNLKSGVLPWLWHKHMQMPACVPCDCHFLLMLFTFELKNKWYTYICAYIGIWIDGWMSTVNHTYIIHHYVFAYVIMKGDESKILSIEPNTQ